MRTNGNTDTSLDFSDNQQSPDSEGLGSYGNVCPMVGYAGIAAVEMPGVVAIKHGVSHV
jgi:hypothetical protein